VLSGQLLRWPSGEPKTVFPHFLMWGETGGKNFLHFFTHRFSPRKAGLKKIVVQLDPDTAKREFDMVISQATIVIRRWEHRRENVVFSRRKCFA
jgi:hypothetical protein